MTTRTKVELKVLDGDGHYLEPEDGLGDYIEPKYRDVVPRRIIGDDGAPAWAGRDWIAEGSGRQSPKDGVGGFVRSEA